MSTSNRRGASKKRRDGGRTLSSRRRPIDVLSPKEVGLLLELISRRSHSGIRNRALIAVLYGAGLRMGEALALRPKDVELDGLRLRVQRGKGGRPRVAALLPDVVPHIDRWLDKRRALGISGRSPLFCTITDGTVGGKRVRRGKPLSDHNLRAWLARLAHKARERGLDKRVHAHGFRHSHADQLRRRGWDVEQIRRQLGHTSLAVTGIYLDHIGANAHELTERMRGESWGLAPKARSAEKNHDPGDLHAWRACLDRIEQRLAELEDKRKGDHDDKR